MKKLSILALAAILVVFFTVPASALENEFGGYWRTRFFSQKYFTGFDRGDKVNKDSDERAGDDTVEKVDTRTRLYYTAKINDNLKLVNKFEMNATWGKQESYGRPGADTKDIQIMNTYADFNLGPVNTTVGVQNYVLFRDFFISSDASGIIARWKAMDNFVLAGSWLKNFEVDDGDGTNENEDDDSYTLTGAWWFTENISLKPSVSINYADQANAAYIASVLGDVNANYIVDPDDGAYGEILLATFGADFDMTFDKWGMWVTGVVQTGEIEDVILYDGAGDSKEEDIDLEGWMIAVGANMGFGEVGFLGDFGLHTEFFYASGDDSDDDDWDDDEFEGFVNPLGSYYWSEIMGKGIFDNRASAGQTSDIVTNLWAVNVGVDMQPLDKLKITFDWWIAGLPEEEQNVAEEDELGNELDLVITYELVEGLNLDVVGAYLFADDATTTGDRGNEEDPYEWGARLSLSF